MASFYALHRRSIHPEDALTPVFLSAVSARPVVRHSEAYGVTNFLKHPDVEAWLLANPDSHEWTPGTGVLVAIAAMTEADIAQLLATEGA